MSTQELCSQMWYIHPFDLLEMVHTTERNQALKVDESKLAQFFDKLRNAVDLHVELLEELTQSTWTEEFEESKDSDKDEEDGPTMSLDLDYEDHPRTNFEILRKLHESKTFGDSASEVLELWKRFKRRCMHRKCFTA